MFTMKDLEKLAETQCFIEVRAKNMQVEEAASTGSKAPIEQVPPVTAAPISPAPSSRKDKPKSLKARPETKP